MKTRIIFAAMMSLMMSAMAYEPKQNGQMANPSTIEMREGEVPLILMGSFPPFGRSQTEPLSASVDDANLYVDFHADLGSLNIAINGTGLPQYMAQSLLEATTERYHFAECPLIDEPSGMGRGVPQGYTQEDLSKAMGLAVSAKPNPATTWVAIDFTLPGDAKTAAVEIVNSLGEKVMLSQLNGNVGQKVLDLRELANGIYTVTVLCGEYYLTEKLVVTK